MKHLSNHIRHTLKNVCFYSNSSQAGNKSFYRRLLPNHLISLNSHEGKKIFEESMLQKNCEAFFSLVQQFITQNQPSTCASATMAMILNALKIDPGKNWKGIWRWYDDYNIKHLTQQNIKQGLTLEQFNRIVQLNFAKSMAFSPLENKNNQTNSTLRQSSLSLFRNSIIACNRRSNLFLTINFHRKTLGQTGIGHFSPIAAYNSKRDVALILDVAKFKYDSYWCSVQQIYDALKPIDTESQQSRGFLINKKKYTDEKQPESPLCFLQLDFQLTRRLKNKIYFHQKDLAKFSMNLLNDQEMHPLLIPIFYQLFTLELNNKQEILRKMIKERQVYQIRSNFNIQKLNKQAKNLLAAFSNEDPLTLIYFLSLIFTSKSHISHIRLDPSTPQQIQMHKLIRKCQVYFELQG